MLDCKNNCLSLALSYVSFRDVLSLGGDEMDLSRRDLLKYALGMPAASWLTNFRALAAPASKMVKITAIKTMGLDNVGDGCLIRIETDAGIVGYGEAGLPSDAARERIAMMLPQLIGQDPIAIE